MELDFVNICRWGIALQEVRTKFSVSWNDILVSGQSQVPPGFRFHPTEEELLCYYLRKKATRQKIDLDVILVVDLNKLEPWDVQAKCKIGTTPQNEWFFFSHKDKKYPTGSRTNRATAAGFWKATGRDKVVYSSSKRLGLRKTLVFYLGRAPCGKKSDWIMYEYRLEDNSNIACACNSVGESTPDDGWVVCRIFKKKHCQSAVPSPNNASKTANRSTQDCNSSSSGQLDQFFLAMEEQENETRCNSSLQDIHQSDTSISMDLLTNTFIFHHLISFWLHRLMVIYEQKIPLQ